MAADRPMQVGMIGLGRMGSNLVRRLMRDGHYCVVYDRNPGVVKSMKTEGATGANSYEELVQKLDRPRNIWIMIPAGTVQSALDALVTLLDPDDIVIDGGNSYYRDDITRAAALQPTGIHYFDVGTSGGVWGLGRGYWLTIGGQTEAVRRLDPIFETIAPGAGRGVGDCDDRPDCSTSPRRTTESGRGPAGAGKPAVLDDVDRQRCADAGSMSRTSRRFPGLVDQDWRFLAACRSADPDLFFPVSLSGPSMAQVAEAKAICAGCPVRRECLAFALRTHQVHGVWGGLSEQERYPLRSAALAGAECSQVAEVGTVHAADLRDDHEHARAVPAADHRPRSA